MTDDMFGGATAADASIDDQIACVGREIAMRHRVYARRVNDGHMTQEQAHRETLLMEAVLSTLKSVRDAQPLDIPHFLRSGTD